MSITYDERFVQQLIAHQPRLRVFVRSLLPIKQDADDVLQEINLVLCRRSGDFVEGTNFAAWALKVAHFQVLAHRQSAARNRLVFEDETVQQIADAAIERLQVSGDREEALRHCLSQLTDHQRRILSQRYAEQLPINRIAEDVARPEASVRQSLYRIRALLQQCIHRRIAGQGGTS